MDLQSYARRAHAFDLAPLSDTDIKKLGRLFDRGAALHEVVKQYGQELGGHPLPVFCRARLVWREYLSWRDCLRAMSSYRQESGQQLVPNDAVDKTWSPACVAAVSRAADNRSPEDYPTHTAWHDAVQLSAELWADSLETSLRKAEIRVTGDDAEDASNTAPLDLDTSAWMAARAGDQAIQVTLPDADLQTLVQAVRARLEERAGLDAQVVFSDVIEPGLLEAIHTVMDRRAVMDHIVTECTRALEDINAEITAPATLTDMDRLGLTEAIDAIAALKAPPPAPTPAPKPRREQRPQPQRSGGRRRARNRTYNPHISRIQDLASGMELNGKVRNLNRFGAFVDVGIDKEGLIPQRALSNMREGGGLGVRNGQMVKVRVLSVDVDRNRFDLELLERLESEEPAAGGDDQGRQ